MRYLILFISLIFISCSNGPSVKIYVIHPDVGLIRTQKSEVITFDKALDYLCSNPSDTEVLFNYCLSPKASRPTQGPDIKIYVIKPQGLTRAQNNQIIPFEQSKGFYCMDQSDYETYLNWCLN